MFEIKPMEYIISKTCRICNIEKPIDNFYKTKKNTDGYFNSCKECDKEKSKQWALNNPNKIKERKQSNKYKEAHRLRSKNDYYKNREIKLMKMKQWRIENEEKLKLKYQDPEYKKQNCDRYREYYNINKQRESERKKIYLEKNHDVLKQKMNDYARRNRKELSDQYVKSVAIKYSKLKACEIPSSFIELKREILKLRRLIYSMSN